MIKWWEEKVFLVYNIIIKTEKQTKKKKKDVLCWWEILRF